MSNLQSIPVGTDDWTALLPDTEHVRFFKSRNWSETLLGPLNTWGLEIRLYTLHAFADARPVCLWW